MPESALAKRLKIKAGQRITFVGAPRTILLTSSWAPVNKSDQSESRPPVDTFLPP